MAEMDRDDSDDQERDQDRRSNEGQGPNQDHRNQPPNNRDWDGNERRTGDERRNTDTDMTMNEGSSR